MIHIFLCPTTRLETIRSLQGKVPVIFLSAGKYRENRQRRTNRLHTLQSPILSSCRRLLPFSPTTEAKEGEWYSSRVVAVDPEHEGVYYTLESMKIDGVEIPEGESRFLTMHAGTGVLSGIHTPDVYR